MSKHTLDQDILPVESACGWDDLIPDLHGVIASFLDPLSIKLLALTTKSLMHFLVNRSLVDPLLLWKLLARYGTKGQLNAFSDLFLALDRKCNGKAWRDATFHGNMSFLQWNQSPCLERIIDMTQVAIASRSIACVRHWCPEPMGFALPDFAFDGIAMRDNGEILELFWRPTGWPNHYSRRLIHSIIKQGNVGLMMSLQKAGAFQLSEDTMTLAIRYGQLDMAKWLVSNGIPVPQDAWKHTIYAMDVEMSKWLAITLGVPDHLDLSCPCDGYGFLKWLRSNGCLLTVSDTSRRILTLDTQKMYLELEVDGLQYICGKYAADAVMSYRDCPMDTLWTAIFLDHLDELKSLRHRGHSWPGELFLFALRKRCSFPVLEYLYEQKCPVTADTLAATISMDIQYMEWFVRKGERYEDAHLEMAVHGCRYTAALFLLEQGCRLTCSLHANDCKTRLVKVLRNAYPKEIADKWIPLLTPFQI